jgi:hypothetical protein
MKTRSNTSALLSASETWNLAENATLRLPLSRFATVVYAERGTVLVTQERDREDHVLEKGDILVLPAGRQVVAWALTDATVSVCDAFVTDAALRATERGVVAAA